MQTSIRPHRRQVSLQELMLLPVLLFLAMGCNSLIDYVFYDLENVVWRFWDEHRASMPTLAIDAVEGLSFRITDMVVAIIAAMLTLLGCRLSRIAGACLLITLPVAPQLGRDFPCPFNLSYQWLELLIVIASVLIYAILAASVRSSSRKFICAGSPICFACLGVAGWFVVHCEFWNADLYAIG